MDKFDQWASNDDACLFVLQSRSPGTTSSHGSNLSVFANKARAEKLCVSGRCPDVSEPHVVREFARESGREEWG